MLELVAETMAGDVPQDRSRLTRFCLGDVPEDAPRYVVETAIRQVTLDIISSDMHRFYDDAFDRPLLNMNTVEDYVRFWMATEAKQRLDEVVAEIQCSCPERL